MIFGSMFNRWPYTDLQNLNLDWLISVCKDLTTNLPSTFEEIETQINNKLDKALNDGTLGDILTNNGNGTYTWKPFDTAITNQIIQAVNNWLNNHPEATTTVMDGSISYSKFSDGLITQIKNNQSFINKNIFGVFAHRGAMYTTFPNLAENTLSAFRWACANEFDGIECDIQYDENNNLVCFHDDTLDATTDCTGYMYDYTYTDVHVKSGLDANTYAGNPALFTDVLSLVARSNKIVWIDVKHIQNHLINIADLIALVKQYGVKFILGGLTYEEIQTAMSIDPYICVAINDFNGTSAPTEAQIQVYTNICKNLIVYMNNSTQNVTSDVVNMLHRNGVIYYSNTYNGYQDGLLSNVYTIPRSVPTYDSYWINATVALPAVAGTGQYIPKYRRLNYTVHLKGLITPNITDLPVDNNTRVALFNLPSGFRPFANYRCIASLNRSVDNGSVVLHIGTDGNVRLWSALAGATVEQINGGIFLDNVIFITDGTSY